MPTGWFVVQPPSSGLLRNNRKPVSVEMAGQQLTDGSIAPIGLKKVSVAMSGQVPLHGPMNIELKKLIFAMNGEEKTFGGLAVTLPKLALDFEQELNQGQMFVTMQPVKLAFALQTQGYVATQLATVDALLSSTQEITGALASRLQYARAIIAGAHQQDGVLTSALKKVVPAVVGDTVNPISPTRYTFLLGGTTTFVTPAGSGYKIDRIALGGGRAGRQYGFGVGSNGGNSGDFAYDTLTEGVHFTAGQTITIAVGAGGASNGASGTVTTIEVNGNTLTGPAGLSSESYISGYTGQPVNTGNANSSKDLLLNGQTYVGGAGGTGTSSTDPAGAPVFPGGGGWGSNSNGVNGRTGGNGCAWLYVYP